MNDTYTAAGTGSRTSVPSTDIREDGQNTVSKGYPVASFRKKDFPCLTTVIYD